MYCVKSAKKSFLPGNARILLLLIKTTMQMLMWIWWTGNPDQRESSLPAELSQKRCGWWWWWWWSPSQLGWWWWSLENRTGTCLFNYFKLQLQLLCNFPQPCTDLNLDENAKYRNSKIQDIFWGLLFRFVGAHRIFTFLLCSLALNRVIYFTGTPQFQYQKENRESNSQFVTSPKHISKQREAINTV